MFFLHWRIVVLHGGGHSAAFYGKRVMDERERDEGSVLILTCTIPRGCDWGREEAYSGGKILYRREREGKARDSPLETNWWDISCTNKPLRDHPSRKSDSKKKSTTTTTTTTKHRSACQGTGSRYHNGQKQSLAVYFQRDKWTAYVRSPNNLFGVVQVSMFAIWSIELWKR